MIGGDAGNPHRTAMPQTRRIEAVQFSTKGIIRVHRTVDDMRSAAQSIAVLSTSENVVAHSLTC